MQYIMLIDSYDVNHIITKGLLNAAEFNGKFSSFGDPKEAASDLKSNIPDILILDFNNNIQDKFSILYALDDIGKLDSTKIFILWDQDVDYVKQLSLLFPITNYYQRPLKCKDVSEILGEF